MTLNDVLGDQKKGLNRKLYPSLLIPHHSSLITYRSGKSITTSAPPTQKDKPDRAKDREEQPE
jgi:hypothetical protein